MSATTYLSRLAVDALDAAQMELDDHIGSTTNGRCTQCHEIEPCPARTHAMMIFVRYGALPRRRPHLALPRSVLRRVA